MDKFIEKALHGEMDSDRHLISIYAMALASRGKTYVELGVREGHTSEPLYNAAKANGGKLWSCLLYTSPSPRDATLSRMPSSA